MAREDGTTHRVPAPAKVNLFLHVTGRRADGYHFLESVFALIDLADTVTLQLRADGVIARAREIPGVPEADDLTLRAARLLQAAMGTAQGVMLAVHKRIPMGGGLGGGSSDAASVLLALNRLWSADGTSLSPRGLATLALQLGADIPFFLGGSAARVSGIGEVLRPVSLPAMWLALAMPPVAVSTAAIFGDAHLTRDTASEKIAAFAKDHGRNDLEAVAVERYPEVAQALFSLQTKTPQARMSGSGGTVFGLFDDAQAAAEAVAALPPEIPGCVARIVARHPLLKWSLR